MENQDFKNDAKIFTDTISRFAEENQFFTIKIGSKIVRITAAIFNSQTQTFSIGGFEVGKQSQAIISGPCSIEQFNRIANKID